MAYLFKDGESIDFQASSATELVDQLRALSQFPATISYSDFMAQFAAAFKKRTKGLIVRTDTPDHFIADLVSHGWLKLVSNS